MNKIDGKKVHTIGTIAIIGNGILTYLGIISLSAFILSAEGILLIMAFRSTIKKVDKKMEDLNKKELTVAPDRSVSRWVR
jgi:small neutral amino acid transporter SnatA (MarC family)